MADKIKKVNSKVKIVLGGVHSSALPGKTLQDQNVDFVVRGEGEVTFYKLVEALDGKRNIEEVKGISYSRNGKIVHNKNRNLIEDLDSLPFPDRDLLMQENFIKKYQRIWGERCAPVLSSRGCPFNCTFCSSHCVWYSKWRARSPENIIKEVKFCGKI